MHWRLCDAKPVARATVKAIATKNALAILLQGFEFEFRASREVECFPRIAEETHRNSRRNRGARGPWSSGDEERVKGHRRAAGAGVTRRTQLTVVK